MAAIIGCRQRRRRCQRRSGSALTASLTAEGRRDLPRRLRKLADILVTFDGAGHALAIAGIWVLAAFRVRVDGVDRLVDLFGISRAERHGVLAGGILLDKIVPRRCNGAASDKSATGQRGAQTAYPQQHGGRLHFADPGVIKPCSIGMICP